MAMFKVIGSVHGFCGWIFSRTQLMVMFTDSVDESVHSIMDLFSDSMVGYFHALKGCIYSRTQWMDMFTDSMIGYIHGFIGWICSRTHHSRDCGSKSFANVVAGNVRTILLLTTR